MEECRNRHHRHQPLAEIDLSHQAATVSCLSLGNKEGKEGKSCLKRTCLGGWGHYNNIPNDALIAKPPGVSAEVKLYTQEMSVLQDRILRMLTWSTVSLSNAEQVGVETDSLAHSFLHTSISRLKTLLAGHDAFSVSQAVVEPSSGTRQPLCFTSSMCDGFL